MTDIAEEELEECNKKLEDSNNEIKDITENTVEIFSNEVFKPVEFSESCTYVYF